MASPPWRLPAAVRAAASCRGRSRADASQPEGVSTWIDRSRPRSRWTRRPLAAALARPDRRRPSPVAGQERSRARRVRRPSASARASRPSTRSSSTTEGRHVTDLRPADFEIVERGKTPDGAPGVYVQVIGPDGRPVPAVATAPPAAAPSPDTGAGGTAARPLGRGRSPAATGSPSAERDRPGAGHRRRRPRPVVREHGRRPADADAATSRRRSRPAISSPSSAPPAASARCSSSPPIAGCCTRPIDRVRWSVQSRSGVGSVRRRSTPRMPSTEPSCSDVRAGASEAPRATELADCAGTLGALEYVLRGIETAAGPQERGVRLGGLRPRPPRRQDEPPLVGVHAGDGSRQPRRRRRLLDRCARPADGRPDGRGRPADPPESDAERHARTDRSRQIATTSISGKARRPDARPDRLAGVARLPGRADRRLRGHQHQRPGRRHRPHRRRHTRLLPARLRYVDPGRPRAGIRTTCASASSGPGSRCGRAAGCSGRPTRSRPRDAAPADPLVAAALSPFATGAIDVRLTTLFAHDAKAGSYVRALFFIDPAGLTFVDGADGRHEADLTLLLLAIGDNGAAGRPGPASRCRCGSTTRPTSCCGSAGSSTARGWRSRSRAAIRSAPPSRTIDRRRSAPARSSSRCRRSARTRSRCRAS